jgi:hypothetical protein
MERVYAKNQLLKLPRRLARTPQDGINTFQEGDILSFTVLPDREDANFEAVLMKNLLKLAKSFETF